MRIIIILIPIFVLLVILPIVLGEFLIEPADVSNSDCMECHKLDEIGITTTTGTPIVNEYEWQHQLHQALDNPDCLACHIIHSNVLLMFQHGLLSASIKNKCALCHVDSVPDDALHSSAGYSCGNCHSTQTWADAFFEHDQFFILDNNHSSTCDNCHQVANDFSQYSCYGGCHVHSESEISIKHSEEGIYDYQDCVRCHRNGYD